jgi:hypothetical protein
VSRASTVDLLPLELRQLIAELRQQHVTIDAIVAKLRELGAEISRSALGRHVKQLEAVGEKIRRSRDVAEALVKKLGDAPESRQARLNIELMHTLVLDLLTGGEDAESVTLDPEQAMMLGRALRDLAMAQKADADLTLKLRQELAQRQNARVERAAEDVAKAASEAGLSAERIALLQAKVAGLRIDPQRPLG